MTTGKGGPDTSRSARVVLKDYVSGKLLYCHPPPGFEQADAFNPHKLAQQHLENQMLDRIVEQAASVSGTNITLDNLEDAEVRKPQVSKRLKKHGRKGRKGRDKDPYNDSDMLGDQAARAVVHQAGRRNLHKQQSVPFVRTTLPHHPSHHMT